jgi:urease beta subunit
MQFSRRYARGLVLEIASAIVLRFERITARDAGRLGQSARGRQRSEMGQWEGQG